MLPKDAAAGFYHRHPLAFLVEAADDLCYRIIDFEDGLKLGLIEAKTGLALLKKMLNDPAGRPASVRWHDWREELGYVRARLIGKLVAELAALWFQAAPAILRGDFDQPLIKQVSCYADLQEVQRLSIEQLYRSRPVLEIEAAGFEVLGGLLDAFLTAVFDPRQGHRSRKLLDLVPAQFRAEGEQAGASDYEKILLLTDFVAGMTDQNALSLYKTIKGIELPKGF